MVSSNLTTIRNRIPELMPLAKLVLLEVFSTDYTFSTDLWITVIMVGLISLQAFIQITSEPYSDGENTWQNDPHPLLLLFCIFMHQTQIHKCIAQPTLEHIPAALTELDYSLNGTHKTVLYKYILKDYWEGEGRWGKLTTT